MNILMATRERRGDERFGMGKSLEPLLKALRVDGHRVDYLTHANLARERPRLFGRCRNDAWSLLGPLQVAAVPELAAVLADATAVGRAAAWLARRRKYDCVHAHDVAVAFGFCEGVASQDGPARCPRWGLTQHSFRCAAEAINEYFVPIDDDLRHDLLDWERKMLCRADWVLTPAVMGLRQLAADLDFASPPRHWHTLTHPRPEVQRYERHKARMQLGWSESGYRVIGVGMFIPSKRFDLLIKACAPLPRDLHLTLIGSGDQRPLRQLADQVGLGERLAFACTDDIGLYLSAADLYVSTSAVESYGMANLEAVISGVPCIVSPVGAVPEVVGKGALLVDPERESLSNAIATIRHDDELRKRLYCHASQVAEKLPTAADVATRFIKLTQITD